MELDDPAAAPIHETLPASESLVASGTTVAASPTFRLAMSLTLTVVEISYPPAPTTTMVAVVDDAVTWWPTWMPTAATVPATGLVIVACSTVSCAARTCVAAASTAA